MGWVAQGAGGLAHEVVMLSLVDLVDEREGAKRGAEGAERGAE